MSRVRTPPSLKWLLDKRARLLGEIIKLDSSYPERIKEAKAQVAQAEIALDLAKRDLAQIESSGQRIIEA